MTQDMTCGSSWKVILKFMIPVCIGSLFQQIYTIADSMVVGRFLGVEALAAIGASASLVGMVTGWINGLTGGFGILIAQSFGARFYERLRQQLAMAVSLCVGSTLLLSLLLLWQNDNILRQMNTPDQVIRDTAGYMAIIYAGLIITAAYYGLTAVLRSLGDSKSPLFFLILSGVLNVILDFVFVGFFHVGVIGCAYATVTAQGVSSLLCLGYINKKYDILKLQKADFKYSGTNVSQLLRLGIPTGLQFCITAIGTIIVQTNVNGFGPACMAAFATAGKIQNIFCTVFTSMGISMAAFAGQNIGAGNKERVRECVYKMQLLLIAYSALMYGAVSLWGGDLVGVFINDTSKMVVPAALVYFKTVSWSYPFLGSIFLYRNVLQGMGYGLVPMIGGLCELLARLGAVTFLSGWGFAGVCMADPLAWLAALLPIVPFYFWKIKRIK